MRNLGKKRSSPPVFLNNWLNLRVRSIVQGRRDSYFSGASFSNQIKSECPDWSIQ